MNYLFEYFSFLFIEYIYIEECGIRKFNLIRYFYSIRQISREVLIHNLCVVTIETCRKL